MAKSRINVTVNTSQSGPVFDGRATAAMFRWLDKAKKDVAERGVDVLMERALKMDKTGRSTGHYAGTFRTRMTTYNDQIVDDGGIVYGPWLEGESKRNSSTRFKGYHQFRRTRAQLRKEAKDIAQGSLDQFIVQMGGTP